MVRGVRGRIGAAIVTEEGRVESALFALPGIMPDIAFLQFIQQRTEIVEVRVVRGERFNGNSDAILCRCLKQALGPRIDVRIRYVSLEDLDTDASGKRPVVISEVPRIL